MFSPTFAEKRASQHSRKPHRYGCLRKLPHKFKNMNKNLTTGWGGGRSNNGGAVLANKPGVLHATVGVVPSAV